MAKKNVTPKSVTKGSTTRKVGIAPEFEGTPISISGETTILSVFSFGSRDIGVVSVNAYNGKTALDVRRFYLDDDKEEYRPTAKGVRIPLTAVDEVIETLVTHRAFIARLDVEVQG